MNDDEAGGLLLETRNLCKTLSYLMQILSRQANDYVHRRKVSLVSKICLRSALLHVLPDFQHEFRIQSRFSLLQDPP